MLRIHAWEGSSSSIFRKFWLTVCKNDDSALIKIKLISGGWVWKKFLRIVQPEGHMQLYHVVKIGGACSAWGDRLNFILTVIGVEETRICQKPDCNASNKLASTDELEQTTFADFGEVGNLKVLVFNPSLLVCFSPPDLTWTWTAPCKPSVVCRMRDRPAPLCVSKNNND
jgi:hypothetical protein